MKFKCVGKTLPRSDALEKAMGRTLFATDIGIPNMVYGRVLRSRCAHARIKRVDTSRAERLPGVKAVLTGADIDGKFNPYGRAIRDQEIVAIDRVRYIGDPVAAVAAVDLRTAEKAISLIGVEYEELPAILTHDEAMAPNAPLIHDRFLVEPALKELVTPIEGTNVCNYSKLRHGDVERGFRESELIFEDIFTTEPNQQGALELHSAIANVSPGPLVEVITNSQTPSTNQIQLSQIFNLPQSSIRVIVPTLGGGFGSKLGLRMEPLAVALALKAGRPVKVTLTREEEFFTVSRHASRTIIKTGVKRDGTIMAREIAMYLDTGAYADFGPIVSKHTSHTAGGPYRIPHLKVDVYCVYTNKVPAGAMRGFGVPQAAWAYEQQIDMIAERLGLDPLEIRKRNILRSGDIFHTGATMEDIGFVEVLEETAAEIGWNRMEGSPVPEAKPRGKGISVTVKSTATPTTATAEIKMNSDGSVILLCNTVEMGQGSQTVLCQILAEALGLPLEKVVAQLPDTNVTPFDFGTFSSRGTFHMGNAVLLAAENLKKELLESAAILLDQKDLIVDGGCIKVKSTPGRSVSFGQAVVGHGVNRGNLKATGVYQTRAHRDKETGHMGGSAFWMEGGGGAEVEVEKETGRVKTITYIGVTNAGKAINPATVEQQILGCIVMALGGTLVERMAYNKKGLLLNPNFIDYKIPTIKDLPKQIVGRFVELPCCSGPYGAKGIAEASLMPPIPAIANAICRATGVRIKDLPITAEKILQGLNEKEQ